jgi:hypothetical protein
MNVEPHRPAPPTDPAGLTFWISQLAGGDRLAVSQHLLASAEVNQVAVNDLHATFRVRPARGDTNSSVWVSSLQQGKPRT